jgi:DNA-binding protein HU-beta
LQRCHVAWLTSIGEKTSCSSADNRIRCISPTINESDSMATRPASTKKAPAAQTAPAKKAAAKKPAVTASKTKTTAKTKAVAAPVVTLKTVFEQLGMSHELSKKQAHGMLADFVMAVTTHLKKGARIRMSGLGTLEVKARDARMGRNPATGEAIQIKASKKVAFRAAKELKEAV